MKYVLNKRVISVHIGNIVYKKQDKTIFDPETKKWAGLKEEIEAACEAGFLERLDEPKMKEEVKTEAKEEVKVQSRKR